jgi:hypothetical protein
MSKMVSSSVLLALWGSLALASPVDQGQKIQKRQDTFGVIPGVPPAFASIVMPLITTTGMLPSIVKSGINGMTLGNGFPFFHFMPFSLFNNSGLWEGRRYPRSGT